MSLSIKLTNARCNLRCAYCYEAPYRDELSRRKLDVEAIIQQMHREANKVNPSSYAYLHGGEALLAPIDALERVLKEAYRLSGGATGIQTNGTLITDAHIELFKRYNTHVGISFDGPWPLNKARVPKDGGTKEASERILKNIYRLVNEGISVGLIMVLTKANGLPEHRAILKDFIREMTRLRIGGRINLAEIDNPKVRQKLELTPEEAEEVYRDLTRFILLENGGYWQPFRDAVDSLMGFSLGTCIFHSCPYYNADAEPVILSDGTTCGCLKTGKSGYAYPRDQVDGDAGRIRYQILPFIDWEDGGCKGCRYWVVCSGSCPAEGALGDEIDWRHRSRHCRAYYGMFEEAERILKRLMPNLKTTPDYAAEQFANNPAAALDWAERNFPNFSSVLLMEKDQTTMASSWRSDARSGLARLQPAQGNQGDYDGRRSGGGCRSCGPQGNYQDSPHGDHTDHGDGWG